MAAISKRKKRELKQNRDKASFRRQRIDKKLIDDQYAETEEWNIGKCNERQNEFLMNYDKTHK